MKKISILLLLAIFIPFLVFAQSAGQKASSADLQKKIQDLLKQIEELQKQVITLQVELVKESVKQSEIPVTTSEVTPPELTRNLSRGASGDDVRKLQEFLAKDKEIYPEGLVTGYFGTLTEVAIKKWQEKYGIEAVGAVGPKTLSKLRELGRGVIQGLLEQGAGASGQVPPGLLTAPGIQKKIETTATTTSIATTTPVAAAAPAAATTTPSGTIPAEPAIPAAPSSVTGTQTTPAIPATPAVPAQTTATTTSPSPYGSALNLSNVSDLLGKIWGPGSNGIIVGGGLNFSTQPGVGWAQQYDGKFVTSYSIQGVQSQYLAQTNSVSVTVTGPAGSVIEVWDLESLTVIATNSTNPGASITFTAQPNRRYGGFAWYADNSQKNIVISAAYSSSAPDTTPPTISNVQTINITANSATVTWATNEVSDSQVEYDAESTSVYGARTTLGSSLSTTHSSTITGLEPNVRHQYRARSRDAAGNLATSQEYIFTTSSTVSSLSQVQGLTATVSGSSVTLSWQAVPEWNGGPTTGGYNIYRGSSADFTPSPIPSNPTNLVAQGNVLSYTNSGLSAGTYYYKVAYQNNAGTVGPASSAVSAVVSTSSSLPAPTYMRADWYTSWPDYRDNKVGQQIIFQYPGDSGSKTTTFRFYQKRSADSSFSLVGEFSGFDSTSCTANGTRVYAGGWGLIGAPWTSCQTWAITRNSVAASSYVAGEYSYYVVAVDSTGKEGIASATTKQIFFEPGTILAPTSSQSPVSQTPIFQWTVGSGWPPNVSGQAPLLFTIAVFDSPTATNPFWTTNIDGVSSPGTNSKVYSGPALDPSKKYRLTIYGWGSQSSTGPSYMTLPSAVTDFWVATTSTAITPREKALSSLDSRAKNLAAISQTLGAIKEQLLKLLQGF